MASEQLEKALDQIVIQLRPQLRDIMEGTGFGSATAEVFIQDREPKTIRITTNQTKKLN